MGRLTIPCAPLRRKNHLIQFVANNLLRCRTATLVVFSVITHRERIFFHIYSKILFPVVVKKVHLANQAQGLQNLVRNILRKLMIVLHPTNFAIIFYANVQLTSMSIGKRTNPLEIFITPTPLELKIVFFIFIDFHDSCSFWL